MPQFNNIPPPFIPFPFHPPHPPSPIPTPSQKSLHRHLLRSRFNWCSWMNTSIGVHCAGPLWAHTARPTQGPSCYRPTPGLLCSTVLHQPPPHYWSRLYTLLLLYTVIVLQKLSDMDCPLCSDLCILNRRAARDAILCCTAWSTNVLYTGGTVLLLLLCSACKPLCAILIYLYKAGQTESAVLHGVRERCTAAAVPHRV